MIDPLVDLLLVCVSAGEAAGGERLDVGSDLSMIDFCGRPAQARWRRSGGNRLGHRGRLGEGIQFVKPFAAVKAQW